MRIVIDMQGAQSESRFRGIGRYTISFAQAVVRNRCDHDIFLALNGLFPDSIEPIRAAFEGLLPQENIRVWFAPGPVSEGQSGNNSRREVAELIRESFLASLQPDVIHISSLFEGYVDDAVTSIGKHDSCTPVSATLFDLIPLLNPEHYLRPDKRYSEYYLQKIKWLNQAACLLAISDSAQLEGRQNLTLPSNCLFNVSTAIEPCFQPLDISDEDADQFCQKLGINRPFVLHTGGCDDRKNLFRLIQAYADLPLELRQQYQLVLAGKMSEGFEFRLLQAAKSIGLNSDELLLAGYVSDVDLICLYNLCTLYVFPSWHEGFGLPALEAMACGAPVVAANTSSLPEVIGLAEAMFDPLDTASITAKIQEGLENVTFRNRLKEHLYQQSKLFSWDITAQRAIKAWQSLPAVKRNEYVVHSEPGRQLLEAVAVQAKDHDGSNLVALAASIALNRQAGVERQLLVDVSEISQHDAATGVQRVVRSYLKHLLESPPPGFRVEPVYALQGGGYLYARNYTMLILGLSNYDVLDHPIQWQRGDIFFGLDMQHHIQLAHAAFFRKLRREGVTVKFLIYDLLPIQHPDLFCQSKLSELHAKLLAMIAETDGAICISKATADAYTEWMQNKTPSKSSSLPVDWVHIGADFDISKQGKDLSVSELDVLSLIQKRLAFLCVATLEPRKGQEQVLDAMEQLWLEGRDYNLTLVGQQGWKTEKLAERILRHPEFGRRLFWLQRVSDDFLERIYSVSTCLIAASINEGFGLPLIEAARHGIPIIGRDIPVFREVAGGGAFFFTGDTPRDLARAIKEWLILYQMGQQPDPRQILWLTWEESTERLCRALLGNGYSRRQLLVDVSELSQRDAKTGIQRVVRSILTEWLTNPPIGWRVEPVYATANSPYRYAKKLAAKILDQHCQDLQDEVIEFAPGDVFLGLDLAPAVVPSKHEFLQLLRRQGVRVEFLVYDLLPLVSSYFEPGHACAFTRWLSIVAECDGAICISAAVANEMEHWVKQASVNRRRSFEIRWFHLGADIDQSQPTSGLPANFSSVMQSLSRCPSFLMVSTLAPHKGHAQVLQAFDWLWNEGGLDLNLVFVGKRGWRIEDFVKTLLSHPELNRRLFWLEGISDEYLDCIYSASTCLVAASYGEGFGLPLIESAQHHIPIIARDIPVFREVAGDHAYYFEAQEASELAVHIQNWLRLYHANSHPKSDTLPWSTWNESAATLLNIITNSQED